MSSSGPPKKSAARAAAAAAAGGGASIGADSDANSAALAAELVVAYLLRECQGETAAAVLEAGPKIASSVAARSRLRDLGCAVADCDLAADAVLRATARDHVRAGRVLDAISAADALLQPGGSGALERRDPALHFALLRQHFIELVRTCRADDACQYAKEELNPRANLVSNGKLELHTQHQEDRDFSMKKLLALMAYHEPESSSVAFFLDVARRESLADRLAGALFAARFTALAPSADAHPALENVVRQCRLVDSMLEKYCPLQKRSSDLNGTPNTVATRPMPPRSIVQDAEVREVAAEEDEMNDE